MLDNLVPPKSVDGPIAKPSGINPTKVEEELPGLSVIQISHITSLLLS